MSETMELIPELKAAQDKAVRDAELAAQREREKIAEERKAEEAARLKREADKKLKSKIQREIADDLSSWGNDVAAEIAEHILSGKVRHVKVVF